MLIELVRADGVGFAATVNVTDASPCPPGEPTTIHAARLFADHVQSRAATTDTAPDPPVAGNEVDAPLRFTSHFAADGAVTDVFADVHAPAAAAIVASGSSSRARRMAGSAAAAMHIARRFEGRDRYSRHRLDRRMLVTRAMRTTTLGPLS